MTSEAETEYELLIRTGKLYHLDSADIALTNAGVPHYLQEESVTGIPIPIPVDPIEGPGIWWTISVSSNYLDEAKAIIEGLPFTFTTNPDVWDFGPSPRGRKIMSIAIWAFIIMMIALFFIVSGCTTHNQNYPELTARYKAANPGKEAKQNFNAKDYRVYSAMGVGQYFPGIDQETGRELEKQHGHLHIPDTSDVLKSKAHGEYMSAASSYAKNYNQAMLALILAHQS